MWYFSRKSAKVIGSLLCNYLNDFNHRNWLNACIVKTAIQKRNATLLDSKWYTVVLWWIYLTQGNSIRNPLLNPTLCHQAKRRSSCYAMLVTIISSGKPSRIWLYIYRVSHYRVRHIPNAEKSLKIWKMFFWQIR